jgi:hypothetical protein
MRSEISPRPPRFGSRDTMADAGDPQIAALWAFTAIGLLVSLWEQSGLSSMSNIFVLLAEAG